MAEEATPTPTATEQPRDDSGGGGVGDDEGNTKSTGWSWPWSSSSNKEHSEGVAVEDVEKDIEEPEEESDALLKQSTKIRESWYSWFRKSNAAKLPRRYLLVTDEDVLNKSIISVRLAIMAAAINTKMLNPNYPIMVTPDAHPDSWDETEPFDFNSATYFLPMCSLLGVAIASVFLGSISDKYGRKRVIWILSVISCGGSVAKYFMRSTFWTFCIGQIVFGFFLGNLPVGMAYIGDVFTSQKEKEKELGKLVSYFVMGNSGGGIIAILMNGSGLFAPLWVGAAMMALSAMHTSYYMVEPDDVRLLAIGKQKKGGKALLDEEEEQKRPTTINKKSLWNIVGGAVADNFGSTGLFPLCLSPLALTQYHLDFVDAGEQPIMQYTGYQWLSVMVAGMVVPATMITPFVFRKIGVAGTCVFGNVMTAIVTFALLMIGNASATTGAFAAFVIVLYTGFPFTVFSQLTTGPMLDVIAPEDKIGYVQGLNNAAMNFGMAIAPWLFGLLADAAGTNAAIWTGIGISCLAALINTPLMFDSKFGKTEEVGPSATRVLDGEDEALVQRALEGEFVPPDQLYAINVSRAKHNKSIIVPKVKPYDDEKEKLDELMSHAEEMFRFRTELNDRILSELNDKKRTTAKKGKDGGDGDGDDDAPMTDAELCEMLNRSVYGNEEAVQGATDDVGRWIGSYLLDKGYAPHSQSLLLKEMIVSAFPPIREEQQWTPENIEESLVRQRRIMNQYLTLQERQKRNYTWASVLGTGGTQAFYS